MDLPLSYHSRVSVPDLAGTEDEGHLSNTTRVPERGEFVCAEWVYFVSLSLQEPILRATRYLPELVQLQKQMFDFSHRRLDRKEVAKLPVQDYIKSLPG